LLTLLVRFRWFALWGVAGVLSGASVTFVAFVSLPAAVLLSVWLWRHDGGRGRHGFLIGLGALIIGLGAVHLDYRSCTGRSATAHALVQQRGTSGYGCGGVDGPLWIIIGGLVIGAGAAGAFRSRWRTRSRWGGALRWPS